MLRFIEGNLFESPCHYLVNCVNVVGAMGSGIAKAFKDWAPKNYFLEYKSECATKKLKIGEVTRYTFTRNGRCNTIINFPTKFHWREPSKLEYIRPALDDLTLLIYNAPHERSLAMPKLGCGLGRLDWAEVRSVIEDWYSGLKFNLDVEVYV